MLALVQALNTRHDGAFFTSYANGALDALHRAETLVIQAAPSCQMAAVREHADSRRNSVAAIVCIERE